MGNRIGLKLLFLVLLMAAAVGAGFYGYNLGLSRGLAESAIAAAGSAAPGTQVVFWPRPWGFGFGFFPFAPLFFILFWVLIARALFWRGAGWRRGYGYGYGCGYGGGVPPAFEEWHRRAHGQPPRETPPAPQSA
jgi:hypothetical protein